MARRTGGRWGGILVAVILVINGLPRTAVKAEGLHGFSVKYPLMVPFTAFSGR